MSEALKRAIELAGGQTALGQLIEKRQSSVRNWALAGRIPAEYVIPVSRSLGFKITPHQLRPDIYPHKDDGLPLDQRGWPL